ncbi:hypothetical protein [uncultured Granulicatella sp.]|uniref:hypothetical protein n=1 Tax=uncultured Granulicatella sp. TaxID=316089 RepID=UPI002617B58E|nr:hypothetical protein [uncultured Granulicatella sp.]
MRKVIQLTLYNLGQAKGFILVTALIQVLIQIGLQFLTIVNAGLLSGMRNLTEKEEILRVILVENNIGLPVFFAGVAILVYSAVIWSTEWSTKGSFIYRLLMLPGSRFSVYLSKLLTMLIITFFLQGVQVIGVFLNYTLSKLFIPSLDSHHVTPWSLVTNSTVMQTVVPKYAIQFFFFFLFGVATIVTIFQITLLVVGVEKKSTTMKLMSVIGYILIAIVYVGTVSKFQWSFYFIGSETILYLGTGIFVWLIGNLLLSDYLLNHKVSV